MIKKRILSGMRPTGPLHLGHLVGALKNWVKLQDEYECLFMVADWHALMSEYAAADIIRTYTVDNVIDWLSVGIAPKKSVIFRQSDVKEHLELAMILSVVTPISWLERCPTYKEQLREIRDKDINNYAFLGYPVLQAADILVYKAEAVPIGEDQLPHLELAREIARRFHNLYHKKIFPLPQALLTKEPRLLGTDNRKMSKSYSNFIALSDTHSDIKRKIISMITDPEKKKKTDPGHPNICNVYTYYRVFSKDSGDTSSDVDAIYSDCRKGKLGCVDCKQMLASKLIESLSQIHQNRKRYNKEIVLDILKQGAKKANLIARRTLLETKQLVGLL